MPPLAAHCSHHRMGEGGRRGGEMRREEVEGEQRGGWERLHRGGREKKEEYRHDKVVREAKKVQTLLYRKRLPSNPSCLWQPLKKIKSHSCE